MSLRVVALITAAWLAGCAAPPSTLPAAAPPAMPVPAAAAVPQPSPPPLPERPASFTLACEGGEQLTVRAWPDEVHVTGLGAQAEVLLRDAGGVTPRQAVFSNPHWRAEFGLGADAREALLQPLDAAQRTRRCRRI